MTINDVWELIDDERDEIDKTHDVHDEVEVDDEQWMVVTVFCNDDVHILISEINDEIEYTSEVHTLVIDDDEVDIWVRDVHLVVQLVHYLLEVFEILGLEDILLIMLDEVEVEVRHIIICEHESADDETAQIDADEMPHLTDDEVGDDDLHEYDDIDINE